MAWYRLSYTDPDGIDAVVYAPAPPALGDWLEGPDGGQVDPATGAWTVHVINGSVVAKAAPTPAEALARAKFSRQGELLRVINKFIETKPDGQTRYDTNLKLNLMQAGVAAMAAGQEEPAAVAAVNQWIAAVQARYFALKAEVEAAVDLATLGAIDLSYATLEAAYGVEGTVAPDPDVYTSDLSG